MKSVGVGLDGHQAAGCHLPDLIPPEPPVRIPDGLADDRELDLHIQLLQDREDIGVVGGVAVVKGDDDGLFRQGRAVLHIVDDLREEHRVEAGVLQFPHLLFKDLRGLGIAPAQVGDIMVHQHRNLDRLAGDCGWPGRTAGEQLCRGGPGESLLWTEGPVLIAFDQPQSGRRPNIGQPLRGDGILIPEGQLFSQADGLRIEGADQQLRGKFPGNGGSADAQLLRLEPAEIGTVGNGGVRPVGTALELAIIQSVRPADHGEKGLNAHRLLRMEAPVPIALYQLAVHCVMDIGIGPVRPGYIRKIRRIGDGDAGNDQQQRQRQRKDPPAGPVKHSQHPPI